MGHHVTSADLPVKGEHLAGSKLKLVTLVLGAISAVGLLGSLLFFLFAPEKSYALGNYSFSWLFALFFFLTITLGGCFWPLLHNLSNSSWGTCVRRIMENLGFVFPFMLVFALPLLIPSVQTHLFEWMTDHKTAVAEISKETGSSVDAKTALEARGDKHDGMLVAKFFYLNIGSWHLRYFLYFAALGFVIWKVRSLSVGQDTDPNPGVSRLFKARSMSSWGVAIFGVTLTFIAVDWIMGLDYTWFSTMWGVYVFAGSALNSMVVILLTSIVLRKLGYLKPVVTSEHDHLMGKLIFAFTIFWAYISFSQFFLIWYANITEETRYFILRNTENWNILSYVLVFGHFAIPFLMLMRSDLKKNHNFMLAVGIYLLLMHFLDIYHMIIPERGPSVGNVVEHIPLLWSGGFVSFLGDLLAFVIVGSGFLFFYLRNLASVALYPHRDPRILESANVQN